MKKEVEVKILEINLRKTRSAIKKIGGKLVMKPTLLKEFYFSGNAPFSSLRLRSIGKKYYLTMKMRKEGGKFNIRDEYEIEVSNFETTKEILEVMGFKLFRKREKIREHYKVGKMGVEIDTYPSLSPYLEIEGTSDKQVKLLASRLGFSLKATTNKTATEIIKDAGLNPDNLCFAAK